MLVSPLWVFALLVLAAVLPTEAQPPHPHLCPTPKTGEPCLASLLPSGCGTAPLSKEPWCDRSKPAAERAAAAAKAMNLTEKIANTGMPTSPLWDDRWNLRLLPGSERLGIPSLLFGEIAHGVAAPADPAKCLNGGLNCSTSFPATLVLAAAFDRAMWREVGAAAGLEARAWSNGGRNQMGTIGWAPNINGFRDPRWGRGQVCLLRP
jgi:beta-D-xylosidase 4|eukprot:COSAG06_NODE_1569_length_9072_cov_3.562242_10_plen_207_part_00